MNTRFRFKQINIKQTIYTFHGWGGGKFSVTFVLISFVYYFEFIYIIIIDIMHMAASIIHKEGRATGSVAIFIAYSFGAMKQRTFFAAGYTSKSQKFDFDLVLHAAQLLYYKFAT